MKLIGDKTPKRGKVNAVSNDTSTNDHLVRSRVSTREGVLKNECRPESCEQQYIVQKAQVVSS
jgi:hypothetical protein